MTNEQFIPPFAVVVIDLMDAYFFADVFDEDRYKIIANDYTDLDIVIPLADRLFWALNPNDKTQEEWVRRDAGFDVHVYDSKMRTVYKAHQKTPEQAKEGHGQSL